MNVNVTAQRNRLPECLLRVRAGAEVAVTSRDHVLARLTPDADKAVHDEIRQA